MLKTIIIVLIGLVLLELLLRRIFPKRPSAPDTTVAPVAIAAPAQTSVPEEPKQAHDPDIELRLEQARDHARSEGRLADADEFADALRVIANHRTAMRDTDSAISEASLAADAISDWFSGLHRLQVGYDRGGQDSKVDEITYTFELIGPVVWPRQAD